MANRIRDLTARSERAREYHAQEEAAWKGFLNQLENVALERWSSETGTNKRREIGTHLYVSRKHARRLLEFLGYVFDDQKKERM